MVKESEPAVSPQELLCLARSAAAKDIPEVAKILGIPETTVEQELESALRKLNASRLPEAIALAIRQRLI